MEAGLRSMCFSPGAWTPKSVILLRDHSYDNIPGYAAVYRVHGPFLFGVSDKISVITDNLEKLPAIVIVRLRNMTAIDATGIAALEELADQLHKSWRSMLVCGARPQPAALMQEAGFDRHVGAENICENITIALKRAETIYVPVQSFEQITSDSLARH
jgi:SulP family sulfate permease